MQTDSSKAVSIIHDEEKQKQVFSFFLQSFYADPQSIEEIKAVILLASDNTSETPDEDRLFLKGAFALLRYMVSSVSTGQEEN